MRIFFWVVSLLSGLAAGGMLLFTLTSSNGAPQEAAGAAIACGFAIIPYVFARAISELIRKEN
jgi:hypothetical protein